MYLKVILEIIFEVTNITKLQCAVISNVSRLVQNANQENMVKRQSSFLYKKNSFQTFKLNCVHITSI